MHPLSLRPPRIALAAAAALVFAAPPAPAAELDRVAAVVNGDAILMSEVDRRFRHLVFDLRQTPSDLPSRNALVRRSLDELVLERLQLRIAEEQGLRIPDAALEQAIESIARRHDATVADLRRSLEAGGIPFSDFRERIRNDLVVENLRRQEILGRIRVSEAEVDRFLARPEQAPERNDEYLLAHILVADPDDPAAARATAEDVLGRLRAGAPFAELARHHSSGGGAAEGGLLGWRSADALPSLFAGVVPQLGPGQTSGVIESPSGFHIVTLVDVRPADRSVVRQTHAAHILVTVKPLVTDDDARQRLERLRGRIVEGEDFGELARFHSDDSASAVRGGDLGWLNPGDLTPDVQAVMDRMREGELSEPFESSWGWRLLRVSARRDHDNTEEVRRAQARQAIYRRKADEELAAWLRELRGNAFVRVLPGN